MCLLGPCVAFVHLLPAQPSDPPSPALAWGPPVSGLRLSLRLDNDIHKLGDDVRLHIAMENFAASESVHGPSPATRCNSRVRIEVRDRIDGLLASTEIAIQTAAMSDQRGSPEPAHFCDAPGCALVHLPV